jgi:hypothetical protein
MKISKILFEIVSLSQIGVPPDSGPNTWSTYRNWKIVNEKFAEKLGFKLIDLFINDDMIDARKGDKMGNKLNISDKFDDFKSLTSSQAKALGFKVIEKMMQ